MVESQELEVVRNLEFGQVTEVLHQVQRFARCISARSRLRELHLQIEQVVFECFAFDALHDLSQLESCVRLLCREQLFSQQRARCRLLGVGACELLCLAFRASWASASLRMRARVGVSSAV